MTRLVMIAVLLLGGPAEVSAQPPMEQVVAEFATLRVSQEAARQSRPRYPQQLARSLPGATGTTVEVHEYLGPSGTGYTLIARFTQASCPEHPGGEPCVWRYFWHEGPETYRDVGEGMWRLEGLRE